jgi:FkbM family methyltransferase
VEGTAGTSRRGGPKGQIHAFEATPAVARRLAENVALNRFTNVTVNHRAVCDREGEVEFNLQEDSEGNSMVVSDLGQASVRVPATTLDAYVARQGISRVDLIKIDVEGVEGLVLEGARNLLSGAEPPVLIIESNPATLRAAGNSPEGLCNRLASFGYRCFGIEQLLPEPDAVWNILAIHSTHSPGEILTGLEPFPGTQP